MKTEIKLEVPQGIKYISEWSDYHLPKGEHCIVDKGVTGCGYTEFCLTNSDNIVLCSPRKLLLENKRDQHTSDINILYLENNIEDFDDVGDFQTRILNHIQLCQVSGLPVKFMVTYDSMHYVAEYLRVLGALKHYTFVVDEFQSIFLDAYFKSEVEFDFVSYLQDCTNVIYLSATPMLDKYLSMIDEFKDLPMYFLDWSKTGYVEEVLIERRQVGSLIADCAKIVESYLSGDYPKTMIITETGEKRVVESKEAVFYFNSVSDITRVINKCNLTPENTIIICSKTEENKKKLKKIKFDFGKVPLKGEKNPMFMFCTSSIYMGVDLYSDSAKSFVFADPNIESLALDISLDLPQIVGRQRNRNNPFKNNLVIYYRTKRKGETKLTQEAFDDAQKKRKEESSKLLTGFSKLNKEEQTIYSKKIRDGIIVSQYSEDFISLSKKTNYPVYNKFIEIANERAWEVSQKDYQDHISVTKAIQDAGYLTSEYKYEEDKIISDFLDNHFYTTGLFEKKLEMYCEFMDKYGESEYIHSVLLHKIEDQSFRLFYEFYGTSGCRSRKFRFKDIDRDWKNEILKDKLSVLVYQEFFVGERIYKKDAKNRLQKVYDDLGIIKKAKAVDLKEFFVIGKIRIQQIDKSYKEGIILKSIK